MGHAVAPWASIRTLSAASVLQPQLGLQHSRMTKKRKRQDDFQKVKLKVGKKKPKLENATVTNFKTKTIHLPEQLKEDGALPTNNRKLNIKVNHIVLIKLDFL